MPTTPRARKRSKRQLDWHMTQLNQAGTPRERLWRACSWLVAEAWRAGRLDEATETVLTKVHDIREEAHTDDDVRHGA